MVWAMAALIIILMALIAWGDLKLMVGFLACVVVVAVGLLAYDHWADQRAAAMIPLSEVELQDFSIRPLAGSVHEVSGRISNKAAGYRLRRVAVRIEAQDCPPDQASGCVTIGQIQPWLDVGVPPGQARDIKDKVVFGGGTPKAKGELHWQFEVVSTEGG